jgi:adenylosuccinate synthase
VIANGVVIDPEVLIEEIDALARQGISLKDRLFISENAHIVLEYHKKEDQLREEALGKKKLGTTIRGIGPCYADKVGRTYAIRMGDFRDLKDLRSKLETIAEHKNQIFTAVYKAPQIDVGDIFKKCKYYADRLLPFTTDTTEFLHNAMSHGASILFEGAQGSLLDLDHGTFPYVTSSNSCALGMAAGCGVPPRYVDRYIGVAKAYTTRVGAGPFPTELDNETGRYLRERGHEYGTTTGRPRRCGWFDAVAVHYAVKVGGINSIALIHLDTLTGLKEIQICTAYKIDGKKVMFFPANTARLSQVETIRETVSGWSEDISGVGDFQDLPRNAQNYVSRIEEVIAAPITMIGVGPKRAQTILRPSH